VTRDRPSRDFLFPASPLFHPLYRGTLVASSYAEGGAPRGATRTSSFTPSSMHKAFPSGQPAPGGGRPAWWQFLILAVLAAGLAACATLPEFKPILRTHRHLPVEIVRRDRLLTPEQSQAVLKRLGAQGTEDILGRHLAFVQEVSGAPLIAGNRTALLVDGPDAYAAMLGAIAAAQDHINLETYIFRDDEVGRRMADALLRKQAEGVQVNVIYDSVGSIATPREFFDRMAQHGIAVLEYNTTSPSRQRPPADGDSLTHRDHRKVLIVDGRVAFTGGINIQSAYGKSSAVSVARKSGSPNLDEGWRDTQIEVRGPAVAAFQHLFIETWEKQNGPPLSPRRYFPELAPAGRQVVQVIGSGPGDRQSVIYLTMLSAISNAERSISITMAYFVPDRQLLHALIGARERGVEVELVLPGVSDHWLVLAAGRAHYEALLEAGVKIYERRDTMLHAKTAVIDGVWSTVGSANMDLWSFLYNEEVNAVILSAEFARQMQTMFRADVAASVPIDRVDWAERPLGMRLKEMFARLWEDFL
jgi:cardiolipin synthase A/B